jgi:hypothetical protein
MRVYVEHFQTPKAGNREDECEDRFQVSKLHHRSRRRFRFAVADGATESAFSGSWAEKLVTAYVNDNPRKRKPITPTELMTLAQGYASRWSKEVWAKPLPWFAQEKAQWGAFSTLLGLYLEDKPEASSNGRWTALGIGDTCLFQVRGDELLASFPLDRSEQFGNQPVLISTNPQSNAILQAQAGIIERSGQWQAGDRFLMMTDALAHWFLEGIEKGAMPWQNELIENAFVFPDQFSAWIGQLRATKSIRNDDVTLLIIRVD